MRTKQRNQVPADEVGDLVKDYVKLDKATEVTVKREAGGTYTVTAKLP
jgi:hypothetical protein